MRQEPFIDMEKPVVTQAAWAEVIAPLAAKFNAAWLSGGEAIWNAEGSEAMAKLLTRMAHHLDNGDDYFIPRHRLAATTDNLALMREAVEEVEAFAVALENSDFANVASELNSQMCCDGHMCGCRGSTVGEYLAHELRTITLAKLRDGIARGEGGS